LLLITLIFQIVIIILVIKTIVEITKSSSRDKYYITDNKIRILGITVTAVLISFIKTISEIITFDLLTPFMAFTWLAVTGLYAFRESASEQN